MACVKKRAADQGANVNAPPVNAAIGSRYYLGKGGMVDGWTGRAGFFKALLQCLEKTQVSRLGVPEKSLSVEKGLSEFESAARAAHKDGARVIFIGNGGSAAIASHMAVDYSKNKGVRAVAFNDAAMLTCLSNDYGYDRVFSKQLEFYATKKDVVVIISSSGRSLNIVAAADAARTLSCRKLITFSGMNPHNTLRCRGELNFYVPCADYGLVELAHLALLHSVASV